MNQEASKWNKKFNIKEKIMEQVISDSILSTKHILNSISSVYILKSEFWRPTLFSELKKLKQLINAQNWEISYLLVCLCNKILSV